MSNIPPRGYKIGYLKLDCAGCSMGRVSDSQMGSWSFLLIVTVNFPWECSRGWKTVCVTRHWAYRIFFINRRLLGALIPLCSAWCIPFYSTFSIQYYCMSILLGFGWLVNTWFWMNSKGHIKPCLSYSGMALVCQDPGANQKQLYKSKTGVCQVKVEYYLNE